MDSLGFVKKSALYKTIFNWYPYRVRISVSEHASAFQKRAFYKGKALKKELSHYTVGEYYGFNQEWYHDFTMNKGGCAATTAAEACLLFKKNFGIDSLYPYDPQNVTFEDFSRFAMAMKPYLRPRLTGVDRLSLYTEGLSRYFHDAGVSRISIQEFSGNETADDAAAVLIRQIDEGYPVPFLLLAHEDRSLYDFIWHWFLINGYEKDETGLKVKAASYGEYVWLDFYHLWDTGSGRKGGMILFHIDEDNEQH